MCRYLEYKLSKEQEKELLSSLAITEIEQNQINKDNSLNDNNIRTNIVDLEEDKLNSKEEKNLIINKKVINKSYLGFISVSIIFIISFIFYQKPEIFIGKNHMHSFNYKYEDSYPWLPKKSNNPNWSWFAGEKFQQ